LTFSSLAGPFTPDCAAYHFDVFVFLFQFTAGDDLAVYFGDDLFHDVDRGAAAVCALAAIAKTAKPGTTNLKNISLRLLF
jgi:hypothetical protein